MFQYRQVLVRLRAGDSKRELARGGLMGRDKLAAFRALADKHGWLDAGAELPERRAIERSEAAVLAWKRKTWPALKKSVPPSGD